MAMLDHVRSWLYVGWIEVFWDFIGLPGLYGFKSIGLTALWSLIHLNSYKLDGSVIVWTWLLHLLIRCHPCSLFAQQFEVRCWQYSAQCVCARRSKSFTWWNLGVVKLLQVFAWSVPAHRDKVEIKCMGSIGEKHQQNQKCICSSLTLSIVSKTKLIRSRV